MLHCCWLAADVQSQGRANFARGQLGAGRFQWNCHGAVRGGVHIRGAEIACVAAAEATEPTRTVRKAVQTLLWRMLVFYIGVVRRRRGCSRVVDWLMLAAIFTVGFIDEEAGPVVERFCAPGASGGRTVSMAGSEETTGCDFFRQCLAVGDNRLK
ncbi:hypothetical protein [Arthrobacter sp. Soil764]|uniref:hypothetical protein n=1 Tax=Arthrobacter sp. Soil764 TaxID=1736403 RepID=UPI0012E3A321